MTLVEIIGGLLIGLFFGFFLQKAGVTDSKVIKGQLLLKNFTVMKVILTAIATGSFCLYFLREFIPTIPFVISQTSLLTALLGGGIFGIGMALLGFCPGTCLGALATQKSYEPWFGFIGMIVGAWIYSRFYPVAIRSIKTPETITTTTLPKAFSISPWMIILPLCLCVILWALIEKKPFKLRKIKKTL